jgi:uncharacterized protein
VSAESVPVAFVAALRRRGLEIPTGATVAYVAALSAIGLDRPEGVYWAGRATLVWRPEDVATYDATFDAFWRGGPDVSTAAMPAPIPVTLATDTAGEQAPPVPAGDEPSITVRYSAREVLRHKDFAAYSHDELHEARQLMADLRLAGALRRTRRLRPTVAARGRPDVRRTMRHALRAGGEPIRRSFLAPTERPRRIVLLCDVSGSMDAYARALLRFVHAAVAGRGRVEAFALGTRLTRLTRELTTHDPDAALARAASAVVDWSGGTRLGEGLREFNDRWGTRGMARGAVVVVLSDGWDRGDPALLTEQMARVRRVAHRVVWVNPLKASAGYEPLAAGMAAALPYVDEFVSGHSLDALAHLVEVLGR